MKSEARCAVALGVNTQCPGLAPARQPAELSRPPRSACWLLPSRLPGKRADCLVVLLDRCVSGQQDGPGQPTRGGLGSGPGVGAGPRPGMFRNIRGKCVRLLGSRVWGGPLLDAAPHATSYASSCHSPHAEWDLELMFTFLAPITSQYSKSLVHFNKADQPAPGKVVSQ